MDNPSQDILASRYKVERLLSKSPLGVAYLASDLSLDGVKVIVTLLPDGVRSSERALRRVRKALIDSLRLLHTNIASIRALEENGTHPFFVMDYTEGLTLDRSLEMWNTLSEGETRTLLQPIAEALDYAHGKGVIHEDVRPENIIVSEGLKPSITGFATSLAVREAVAWTQGGTTVGGVGYLSPEQLLGSAPTDKSDIYSFAAVAYECMTGHPPFFRGQVEYQVVNAEPEPLPVDTPFTRAVMRALSKDPAKRPQRCIDVILGDIPSIPLPPEEPPVVEEPKAEPKKKRTRLTPKAAPKAAGDSEERGAAMKKLHSMRLTRRMRDVPADDEFIDESPDFFFRMKTEPALQAATLGLVVLVIVALLIFASKKELFSTNKLEAARPALINRALYDNFYDIDMAKVYPEPLPVKGMRTDFGEVTGVSPYGNSILVKLDKPVYKIFSEVKVVYAKVEDGYKIRTLIFNKDGSGQDPIKVKMAATKIAELLGSYYGIDFGETLSNKNESYFSNKYSDGFIEIKISCAVSKESTNFLLSIERTR